jgi:hypothetical protein
MENALAAAKATGNQGVWNEGNAPWICIVISANMFGRWKYPYPIFV